MIGRQDPLLKICVTGAFLVVVSLAIAPYVRTPTPTVVTFGSPRGLAGVVAVSLDTPVDEIAEPGPTFQVARIVLSGPQGEPLTLTAVPQATLEAITGEFTGHELGSHRLNELVDRLTAAYVAAGYRDTCVVIGPVDSHAGVLRVEVETGLTEVFTLKDRPAHWRLVG